MLVPLSQGYCQDLQNFCRMAMGHIAHHSFVALTDSEVTAHPDVGSLLKMLQASAFSIPTPQHRFGRWSRMSSVPALFAFLRSMAFRA